MENTLRYWVLVRLNASGGHRLHDLAIARAYFDQHFPELMDSPDLDRTLQAQLFQNYQSGDLEAGLCLRCFISHTILQECRSLVRQFGDYYHFNESEVLMYVLDDEGSSVKDYLPLGCQILQTFAPTASRLTTWATRLVRQHPELNRFLKEQGLYLISDWAILNDTKPGKLKQVLIQSYQWAIAPAEEAALVLESFRAVYLTDRVAGGAKGRCVDPTSDQLQRMAAYLKSKSARSLSPEAVFNELQQIAKRLRQHRLERYCSTAESIEIPKVARKVEQITTDETTATDAAAEQFLRAYRPQFLTCLDTALAQVVSDRLTKFTTADQPNHFLTALQMFHCQHLSMTEIAKRLALRGQDTVTKLLKLKAFRTDVRLHMLTCLKTYVIETAKEYTDPAQLRLFDRQIDTALSEQIESLIEVEAKQSATAKKRITGSLFSERLCAHLDCR